MPTQTKTGKRRQQISRLKSIPAPVGGWNALDSIADMKETDAVILDNWFPGTDSCAIRGGSVSHATGMTGSGKTLMVHNGLTGTNKMFCSTESGVYNVTAAGAVGSSVAARTSGKHQWLMFGDGTNQWLIAVNGADKPLYYDGTNWVAVDGASSPALTGLTTTTLIGLCEFKGRLIFIQKDTLAFWYLAAGVAGGALTKFDLSGVAQKGGYIMAVGSWTLDSGAGPDDRIVFVTSEGELIVYQGTDPSSANTWALVGRFTISKPLGRKCILKQGADLIILTQNGAFHINTLIQATGANFSDALSRKIENAFNDAARSYGSNYGWKAVVLPLHSAALVNIPVAEGGLHYQYVMNTITKSWCRFIGWDGDDFQVFNDELYYCQGTKVIKAWTGVADQGANISALGKTAFSYFGNNSQQKIFKMFRPMLSVNGTLTYLAGIDIDFESKEVIGVAGAVASGSLWGTAVWGVATWGSSNNIIRNWVSISEWPGYAASAKLKIETNVVTVKWLSCDFVFEDGGIL